MYEKPTSQSCFEKLFEKTNLNWKETHILPKKVSIDTSLGMFQYKILSNILFLNKLPSKFKKVSSPLHIFYSSNISKRFWNQLQDFVSQNL